MSSYHQRIEAEAQDLCAFLKSYDEGRYTSSSEHTLFIMLIRRIRLLKAECDCARKEQSNAQQA